ncbi:hypothetical protein U2150_06455 [Methanothermobacter wolfeii]|uniref:Uncharacterized protein n=1 Tax=Methanothermobacter wolfeii TaxID=145261 RepID=A0A9E7UMY6_METWO|nr:MULTISPECIES: hypothetical protein [Methanothermobacter]NLM02127.1 hypothetical protein [Methanothermobacter wolfeii]QHN05679.1 hypothetical protein FZP57_00265 [Methanothermobacter sp. THM-1]UXH31808.1 hypothetical protein N5910_00400 [Methanothermobacter wolfeii]SCM55615.1 hypothetical Protein MWSIV6_0065 [Methanothermobacter wolfeii]
MDEHGYISTLDAVLALTVVFLMAASFMGTAPTPIQGINHGAGDVLDTVATYPEDRSILDELAESGDPGAASEFLNETLTGMKYNLTMDNGSGEVTVASNDEMGGEDDLDVAVRNRGDLTFRLYVWRS